MNHEIIRNDFGRPVEVRVTLPDGRIACAGIRGGMVDNNEHIPSEKRTEIEEELSRESL